jgi:hypothetical protein
MQHKLAGWAIPVRVDNLDRKKSRSKTRLIKPRQAEPAREPVLLERWSRPGQLAAKQ